MEMIAKFQLLALKNGKYEILTEDDVDSNIAVGEFWFLINGKEVHFDFEGYSLYHSGSGVFIFESNNEISDYYDEDLAEIGLFRSALTARFLSSASEIKDFHVNFLIDEEGEEREIDIGYFEENNRPDASFKINLQSISFSDNEEKYLTVKKEILQKFNETKEEDEESLNALLKKARLLNENTPNGCIRDADTILHDIMDEADFEITGIGAELFGLFSNASQKEREMFEKMFYLFTDVEFEEYLRRCAEETTTK